MKRLIPLLIFGSVHAAPWDGEMPANISDDAQGNKRVLCGFVHENKRFWRIFPAPRCPKESEPTHEEIERMKSALPFRPR